MEQEGVIKYSLDFQKHKINVQINTLEKINSCRTTMINHGLLGQVEGRYDGYGFGNISIRSSEVGSLFLVTGSQTGHEQILSGAHLSRITHIDIERNALTAQGEIEPSSESMTHGVLYQQSEQIKAVVHVHAPDIWHCADALNLASTAEDIPYGTPEMALAVQQLSSRLMQSEKTWPILFVMKGHEDGVIAAGASLEQCTKALLDTLALSKKIAETSS